MSVVEISKSPDTPGALKTPSSAVRTSPWNPGVVIRTRMSDNGLPSSSTTRPLIPPSATSSGVHAASLGEATRLADGELDESQAATNASSTISPTAARGANRLGFDMRASMPRASRSRQRRSPDGFSGRAADRDSSAPGQQQRRRRNEEPQAEQA